MATCSFCGSKLEKGTGLKYVKKDGKIQFYCKKKCEKNMLKLGRKPRATGWTAEHHKEKRSENK